ncbi:hypothetical protein STEG23_005661, partial [Scotinomys teguina]
CRAVCSLNTSDRCDFIRMNPDCHSEGGYLDYLEGIFCHFAPNLLPLVITLYVFWLLYLFLILGVTAAKFFCPNLSAISTNLKLSHNVAVSFDPAPRRKGWLRERGAQGGGCDLHETPPLDILPHGVTFLAFGNGAPDIFSALVAFSDPRTAGLAIGALFGYLGLYVFYVITVILCTWVYQRQRSRSLVHSMPETPEMLSDSEEDQVSSNTNSYDYDGIYDRGLLPVWAVVVIVGTALASVTFFATSNREPLDCIAYEKVSYDPGKISPHCASESLKSSYPGCGGCGGT